MPKPNDRDERRRKLMNAVRPGSAPPTSPVAPGWTHETVDLPASHRWKCSPGHLLLIADRGEVHFEYPEGWHVAPGKKGELNVRDKPHPADECRIQLSIIRTPCATSSMLSQLPLDELLRQALSDGPGGKHSDDWTRITDVTPLERPGLKACWAESSWLDHEHGDRKVLCRQLIARAPTSHPFFTFDYYEDRADDFRPVWTHLIETLRVASPRSLFGDALN